ncbi:MAG TPA: NADH-quinone oxidoreductase subunit K [bacterium]|nr:NADH-quinone oxidoreductase subunit K [bacterium]
MSPLLALAALAAGGTGLYGVLTQTRLSRKIAAWALVQAGLALLPLALAAAHPNALSPALALDILSVSLALGLFFWRLAASLRRDKGTEDEKLLSHLEEAS